MSGHGAARQVRVVFFAPPVPEPIPLEGAGDAGPEVEEGRGRKPRDDERREVDGIAVVTQEEALIFLRVGEVPSRRPLGDVVLDHVGRGDLRDAVDAHGEVLVLRHRVAVPAPVGKVERHEDHGGVHDQAEEVEPPVCNESEFESDAE